MVYSRLHRTSYSISYLKVRGEGSLMVGVKKREADDHIGAIYGVYTHRRSITVTAV
jgi:hypothetical protein